MCSKANAILSMRLVNYKRIFSIRPLQTFRALQTDRPPETDFHPLEEFEALKEQMEKLKNDNDLLTDKYKRALADMENLRKRSQRLIDEAKLFAIQPFCKDLLEVADVLDLALNSMDKAKVEGTSIDTNEVHKGIQMTKDVLLKTFSKHGLVPVRPEGHKFDPNLHEAVFEIPKEESKQPAGYISHVLNIGYSLHNRPIRPAKVEVVKME